MRLAEEFFTVRPLGTFFLALNNAFFIFKVSRPIFGLLVYFGPGGIVERVPRCGRFRHPRKRTLKLAGRGCDALITLGA